MSVRSQTFNMHRLSMLLSQDLSYIHGPRECGPNGAKKTFLNVGKAFLRELSKDLGLRCVKVTSNADGIGTSGCCTLYGMWEYGGIFISLEQLSGGNRNVVLYRSIRDIHDHKGGYNHFLRASDLGVLSYEELLDRFAALRKDICYERAA